MPAGRVTAIFAGDTKQVSAAFARVNQMAANTTKEFKKLGLSLGAGAGIGILVGAVSRFAATAIEGAQKTRDEFEKLGKAIPDQTRALASFGDGLEGLKQVAVSVVGAVVSGFNRVGEAIGRNINTVVRGTTAAQQKAMEESERSTVLTLKKIDEARKKFFADNSPERLAAAEAKAAKTREDAAVAEMSAKEKVSFWTQKISGLQENVNNANQKTVRYYELQEELTKAISERKKAQGEIEKDIVKTVEEQAKKQKELTASVNKAIDERSKLNDRLEEAQFKLLSGEEQLLKLEQERSGWAKALMQYKKQSNEHTEVGIKLAELDYEIAQRRAEEEEKIAEAKERQKESAEAVAKAAAAGLRPEEQKKISDWIEGGKKGAAPAITRQGGPGSIVLMGIDSKRIREATDEALKETIRRQENELQQFWNVSDIGFGDLARAFSKSAAQNLLSAAKFELEQREKLRSDVAFFGVEGARRQFSGDPLIFDRLKDEFTKGLDVETKSLRILERIDEKLAGKFRNQ